MRISKSQIEQVVNSAVALLGYEPVIWLFGSRTDDTKTGGDFDFLIETAADPGLATEIKLKNALESLLGRKTDLIFSYPEKTDGPWQQLAKLKGIKINDK